ncbi:MAG: phosphatase PAP2 family protein [Rhodospirillales bacterium]|nr:phosphatase PAP2 family protein [Rhodospirillales bacterium]
MGSMWLDPPEDPKVYPMQGLPVLPFDATKMTAANEFLDDRWGADFQGLLWIIDFLKQPLWQVKVSTGIAMPPATTSQDMKDALQELVNLQETLRQEAMPEILAQATDFQMWFCAQLGLYPRSHPKSYLFLKLVARIGELVMVYLKYKYNAVRPSQVYPRLTPPVPVPPHASYPSGHAMNSYLMALATAEIVPDLGDAAERLAQRIAKNREIAGLHFWWDSLAGKIAAENTFGLFKTLPKYIAYRDAAIDEWSN